MKSLPNPSCLCNCLHDVSPPVVVNLSNRDGKEQLQSNLQQRGYSHIRVPLDQLKSFLSLEIPLDVPTVSQMQSLFRNYTENQPVVYRGMNAESGSPTRPEPKQSLEYSTIHNNNNKTDVGHCWMRLMHSVVVYIANWLELSSFVVQQQQDEECMDRMRIFEYVPSQHPAAMGSSPHTDWGSFTLVWQSANGLQTLCPTCRRGWCPVEHTVDSSCWDFVLHVGDVTSLAMNRTRRPSDQPQWWPSPWHCVVCPKTSSRVSLVYFAYPPRSRSLNDLQESLPTNSKQPHEQVPKKLCERYSLLQDQSPQQQQQGRSPWQVLNDIQHCPLGQVFDDKWNQVQRN